MQMNQNMMGGYTSPAAVTTDLIQQVLIRTQPRARSILVSSDLFFFVYALNFPSLSLSDPGSLSPFVFALFFFLAIVCSSRVIRRCMCLTSLYFAFFYPSPLYLSLSLAFLDFALR